MLKFGPSRASTDLSQKVWFRWAKVLDPNFGLSTYLDQSYAELTDLSRLNLHGRDSLSHFTFWLLLSESFDFCSANKSNIKLNFDVSPDFSVQLKVSLSESLSERLSQKLKWPSVSMHYRHCQH